MEGQLTFLGHPVTVGVSPSQTAGASLKDGAISLRIPAGLGKKDFDRTVEALLWRVLAKGYQGPYQARMIEINRKFFQLDPLPKLDIRRQYRRWGSYSSRHHIHLSHRLLLAPPELVDYVIIHEMAHAIEMNHSRDFWRVVERACPEYRQRRQQLMAFSAGLPHRGRVPSRIVEEIRRQLTVEVKTSRIKQQDKQGFFSNLPWKR